MCVSITVQLEAEVGGAAAAALATPIVPREER